MAYREIYTFMFSINTLFARLFFYSRSFAVDFLKRLVKAAAMSNSLYT